MKKLLYILIPILLIAFIFALVRMESRLRYVENNFLVIILDDKTGQKSIVTNAEFQELIRKGDIVRKGDIK